MSTHKRLTPFSPRQFIAITLIGTLIGLLKPASVAAAALRVTEQKLTAAGGQAWQWLESVGDALRRSADAT